MRLNFVLEIAPSTPAVAIRNNLYPSERDRMLRALRPVATLNNHSQWALGHSPDGVDTTAAVVGVRGFGKRVRRCPLHVQLANSSESPLNRKEHPQPL